MEEDARMTDYEDCVGGGDEERVLEWEAGLPSAVDLTPLSQSLISHELASAFSITAEPYRSMLDVNRASQNTMSSLRRQNSGISSNGLKSLPSFMEDRSGDPLIFEEDEHNPDNSTKDVLEKRKVQSLEIAEEADSILQMENSNDDLSARTLKRPRLVWTPQLHKRFVDVVMHLGIKNAVPKTIIQLMNVDGLTRENVASHLQKYRLYLRRMQGLSDVGPSSADQLVGSTPVPPGLHESSGSGHTSTPSNPNPYGGPLLSMPVLGVTHGHVQMGMPVGNPSGVPHHGFEFHPYNVFREQQRDWSGNMFGSIVPYHQRVSPGKK